MKSERFVGTGVAGPSTTSAISKIKGIEQQLNQEVNVLVDVAWSPESSYVTGVAYNTGEKSSCLGPNLAILTLQHKLNLKLWF